MNPYILSLSDPRANLDTVGGKGLSLARMINAGLPVPGGFLVTTAAYQYFVSANGIQPRILHALSEAAGAIQPATLESISQSICQLFAEGRIPAEVADAISAAYLDLKDIAVAVRSSATAEDLPGASFAGQQETYLNIRGAAPVLEAIKNCWASLWTARAIAYRLNNRIQQENIALAVVVQELVFADAAGILFTANPINGSRDELVINAAWGLGEAVVSGAVTPDTLTVEKKNGRILRRATAEKQVMTIRTEGGTREVAVPDKQKKRPVLSGSQTAQLARLGVRIEQFYGMPMDVEWALADHRFAILQARPITALPPEWKVPYPGTLYARGSLAEHIPGPVTPLFATLGLEIANLATANLWEGLIGKGAKSLLVGDGFYLALNGYVFGGMRMTGKELFKAIQFSLANMGYVFHGSVERWRVARQKLAAVVETWPQKQVELLSAAELYQGARRVFGAACHYFTDIQTSLPAASTSEVLFTRLYTSLIKRIQDPEAAVFLIGFDTMALQAEKSLYDLSVWLKANPILANVVENTPTGDLAALLSQEAAPDGLLADLWLAWQQRFRTHLAAFGQTAFEFDFANPTQEETPGPLLDAIKGFLSGKARSPYERQRDASERREQATLAVLKRVGWPRSNWFKRLLRWAQETGPMREDSIFDMGMGHPLIRRLFGELGRRLAAGGAIERAEDIYWLEKVELEEQVALLESGQPLPNLAECVSERRAQWQTYLKTTPPVMLPEKSGWLRLIQGGEAEQKAGKTVLKGVGTSSGRVTAPACVLFNSEDFSKFRPGDVLVAVTTTPAWTPLFATASAVVTDIGGPLSHSSIVAREYGIPAVMAARSATRRIRTGQWVTVDGSAGTVTLE